jgi:NitT/TauT family transport system permease protein
LVAAAARDRGGPDGVIREDAGLAGVEPRPGSTRAVRRARRARATAQLWLARLIVLAVILALWQAGSGKFLNPFFFSSPTAIGARLVELVTTGELWFHLGVTFQEMAAGFVIGTGAGIAVGLLFGSMPFVGRVFDPFILALYSLPKIALAPLLIIWFGLDLAPKIVLSAMIVFFLVFFNTMNGVRNVDRELVDVIRLMGASKRQVLQKVTLPAALASIFVGLRVSLPYALVGAVTGELIASNKGLGSLIQKSAAYFDTPGVFAGLIVLMLITTVLDIGLQRLEARTMRWRRAADAQQ